MSVATDTIDKAKKALETEKFATDIYQYLAGYTDKSLHGAFSEILSMEKVHINFWSEFLEKRGVEARRVKPGVLRLRFYKVMLRTLGKGLTLRIMENSENQAIELYSSLQEDPSLTEQEKQEITGILGDELLHEDIFINEESKFGSFAIYIKDAVLGMSDGLVEILAVTTGLTGAAGIPIVVAISGIVVGIAGALSMGFSTFSSTRSQRQVHEGIVNRIVSASRFVGHVLKERVFNHLTRQGYSHRLSRDMAEESANDHHRLSNFIAEQEYGIRKENLANPSRAALYAGLSNLIGSLIPLIPYFFVSNILTALILSLILATIALAVTGFFVSIMAYLPPGKKIMEMVFTGLGSAAVTYGIGRAASFALSTRLR